MRETKRLLRKHGKGVAVTLLLTCLALTAEAGEFSRVTCDASVLPAEKRLIAELVTARVAERTPASDAAAALKVTFALDPTVTGERASVTVRGSEASVRAGRMRGLVFGAGTLLRAIRYGERTFALEDGMREFAPAKPFRQVYFARHLDNWYHRAPADEFVRYVEDLALWGVNAFHMQTDYPMMDTASATEADLVAFDAVSVALSDRIAALDLDLTAIGGENSAPMDMPIKYRAIVGPRVKGAPEYLVCPEKPGARTYLEGIRRKALEREKALGLRITGYTYWPYDEGGCECETCSVWGGVGYPKLMTRLHEINEEHAKGALHLMSTWFFDDEDWKAFYRYLETKPGWIDYLIIGDPYLDCPTYTFEHPVPGDIPVITFPEISMWGRSPWGGYGATALPKRTERQFRMAEKHVQGCQQYSEGIYEDINKIVVNGLYVRPTANAADILREYAAYEFPGTDSGDFVRICEILEQNHVFPRKHEGRPVLWNLAEDDPELKGYRARAEEAKRLAEKMDREMLRGTAKAWRWRLVYLRALIDREMFATREAMPETARAYHEEIVKIYHAEFQLAKWRRARNGYTCPHLREVGTHDYARPVCDMAALPDALRGAAEKFVREASRRTKVSDDAPPLRLELRVEARHRGDPLVRVRRGVAEVTLARAEDAERAVGGLLRRLRYWRNRISIADGEFRVTADEEAAHAAVEARLRGGTEAVTETAMRRYSAYELPGSDPDDFVKLIGLMDGRHAQEVRRLVNKIDNEMRPEFRDKLKAKD